MQFGIGMGLATTFVLVCSNVLVSVLRKTIPAKVRIACFIIIIATFVTLVELLMQAFAYPLFLQLGIFIPLIVVNCVVLGRAEAFASKNGLFLSIADGLGIGIGFTISLAALGALREILGAGTLTLWEGIELVNLIQIFPGFEPFQFMVQAPGAFVCLGIMLCFMNMVGNK
jgi:electron transport complex protein RnfE